MEQMTEEIEGTVQGPDESRFEYAARMESMRHAEEISARDALDTSWPEADKSSETQPTPIKLWSFGLEADELLTTYGALRVYLRTLVSQEREDLAMIKRTVDLMLAINPSAVEASKFVAEQTNTLKPAQI